TRLQQRQRGVGDAAVDVALLLAGEAARAVARVGKGVGGRGVDGRHQRTQMLGRVVAEVNGAGAEPTRSIKGPGHERISCSVKSEAYFFLLRRARIGYLDAFMAAR